MHMDMARGATVTSIHGMSYFRVSLFSLSKRCCDVSEASRSFWRTNMSSNLFWRCSGVSQLLPVASWTRLSSNLFWRCSGVSQLLCVASWTRLSSNLFWRCSGVSQLLCVASWTRLSSNLFWRCSGVSQLLCVASWNTLSSIDLLNSPTKTQLCWPVYWIFTASLHKTFTSVLAPWSSGQRWFSNSSMASSLPVLKSVRPRVAVLIMSDRAFKVWFSIALLAF